MKIFSVKCSECTFVQIAIHPDLIDRAAIMSHLIVSHKWFAIDAHYFSRDTPAICIGTLDRKTNG